MDHQQELSAQIESYVIKLYDRFQTENLYYHNLMHTKKVVQRAKEIAEHYSEDSTFLFIVNTAAWFHDCGQLFGTDNGHERRSNLVMRGYLAKNRVEETTMQLIEQLILATHFPYAPTCLMEEILCDADSYHLGTDDFLITDELMKNEMYARENYSPVNWDQKTLVLLERHHFFTNYCIGRLAEGKQKNIERLRLKIEVENSAR